MLNFYEKCLGLLQFCGGILKALHSFLSSPDVLSKKHNISKLIGPWPLLVLKQGKPEQRNQITGGSVLKINLDFLINPFKGSNWLWMLLVSTCYGLVPTVSAQSNTMTKAQPAKALSSQPPSSEYLQRLTFASIQNGKAVRLSEALDGFSVAYFAILITGKDLPQDLQAQFEGSANQCGQFRSYKHRRTAEKIQLDSPFSCLVSRFEQAKVIEFNHALTNFQLSLLFNEGGGRFRTLKVSPVLNPVVPAQDPRLRNSTLETERVSTRIVGGSEAPEGMYPFIVSLMSGFGTSRFNHFCSGTLIAPEWVLTAAHCLTDTNFKVVTGRHDLDEPGGEIIGVAEVIPHPDFNVFPNDSDIGLIRLKKPASQPSVRLIDAQDSLSKPGTQAWVAGWGAQQQGQSATAVLNHVDVPIAFNDFCNTLYPNEITDNMLCAGYVEGEKDACQGDSGGPLMVEDPDSGEWLQVGIVSWGEGCAQTDYLGVYTRVSSFLNWIASEHSFTLASSPPQFPITQLGQTSLPVVITLNNQAGFESLVVSSITLSDPSNFVMENDFCTGQVIEPGTQCTFEVLFSPQEFGKQTLQVQVGTDDDSIMQSILISGATPANFGHALNSSELIYNTGGDADWFEQSQVTHDNDLALSSGEVLSLQESWVQTTIEGEGVISFFWRVSSEENFDYLTFYVDDLPIARISGEVSWVEQNATLEQGVHELRWIYSKDPFVSTGEDRGWLDEVSFHPNEVEITVKRGLFGNHEQRAVINLSDVAILYAYFQGNRSDLKKLQAAANKMTNLPEFTVERLPDPKVDNFTRSGTDEVIDLADVVYLFAYFQGANRTLTQLSIVGRELVPQIERDATVMPGEVTSIRVSK